MVGVIGLIKLSIQTPFKKNQLEIYIYEHYYYFYHKLFDFYLDDLKVLINHIDDYMKYLEEGINEMN